MVSFAELSGDQTQNLIIDTVRESPLISEQSLIDYGIV